MTTIGNVETFVTYAIGRKVISGGSSGWIELLDSGEVLKTAHSGSLETRSRQELEIEARIYQHLGPHPRLVQLFRYCPSQGLFMEYMPNGNLKEYLRQHHDKITLKQRFQWAYEAAEGLQFLHSRNVVWCDMRPRNILLDANLELKLSDFGGSSLNGSTSLVCGSERFYPDHVWNGSTTPHMDLFALGSTIYEIMTSTNPYEDVTSGEVQPLFNSKVFPDVSNVPCGELIGGCWRDEVGSAEEVYMSLKARLLEASRCPITETKM
ncbi:kinase-like protein [Byssothecium circinans]|uniref:Kinase-like protein n=1 Tax=Byssothecium circinans TaxID=147558 RepID=A0A6A5U0Y7_9PLEO|nr:kinase-like protein [Byssothecium circinans]